MDIEEAARELYGLAPEEFVAARNAFSRRVRSDGHKDAALQVQAMRKPTSAAWLVNQLTRRHQDEVRLLLELGAELRAGMAGVDADELRTLTRRRYQLVSMMVQQAQAVASGRGRPFGAEVIGAVRATLEATLADADAAALVASGCLVEALEVSGFGLGMLTGASELDRASAFHASSPVADLDERRRLRDKQVKQAAADVSSGELAVREADDHLKEAQVRLAEADERRAHSAAVVQRLTDELARATTILDERADAAQQHARASETAAASVQRAHRELAEAQARRRRLGR